LDLSLFRRVYYRRHWRAIEWGYREGSSKYSLGGTHLLLRKFGGEIVPTTRDRSKSLGRRRSALSSELHCPCRQFSRPGIVSDEGVSDDLGVDPAKGVRDWPITVEQ
jgi:hypothetical protein